MKDCPKCGRHTMRLNGRTPSGKPRWECRSGSDLASRPHCYTTTNPDAPARDQKSRSTKRVAPLKFDRALSEAKIFVITSAQNGTPVNEPFLASLKRYCKVRGAELVVIPLRYKNPTSRWTQSQENAETWAAEVMPFLCNQRIKINKNLVLLGDVKVQPTATHPLSGFEGLTHGESCIVGHPKVQFVSVPVPSGKLPKIMCSTGAITVRNYTDSRAGKTSEFHHVYGALVVELRGPIFHLRQINAAHDGSFTDLDKKYTPRDVTAAPRAAALVLGDLHRDSLDPGVERAVFGRKGMIEVLRPRNVVYHDLFDGASCNPHTAGNPFVKVGLQQRGADDIRAELKRAIDFVVSHAKGHRAVVVASNHGDFLQRWMATDWRQDPKNADLYLQTALALVQSAQAGDPERFDAFGYWMSKATRGNPNIKALARDESFTVDGVALDLHGDRGSNGARGSLRGFKRLGARTVTGHSHTPGIDGGAWAVGTCSRLRLGYNSGPSSWLHTMAVIYGGCGGKRSLITVIGDQWRAG